MTGVPAVVVTVDKEQSEMARPSRALCPKGFRLGNSLGKPGQKELQKKVILDALDLLIHPVEPGRVVEKEYPEYQ